MSTPLLQVFIRNDKGKVWGPLSLGSVELLFENGLIEGKVQVSEDGESYVFPGRLPGVRGVFPRELWGDVVVPGDDGPAPAAAPGVAKAPNAPVAGPGAVAAASRAGMAGVPIAGPGTRSPAEPKVDAPSTRPPPILETPGAPPPASGSLANTSLLRLYYLAASGNHTGLLTLTLPDRTLEIHFRKGNPEYVASSHAEDSVEDFLLKSGVATASQLTQAKTGADKFGGDLVAALFGLGILNPGTAFAHLIQRATLLLFRGILATQGTFTFEAKELPAHKAMPLGNRWAVLADQVRRIPSTELRQRLSPALDLPVMKSGGQVAQSELRLSPQETRAAGYFDGVRSLSQLLQDVPQDADHILRTAFLLRDLELVSFAAVPVRAKPSPPPEPPKPAPAPPPPAAGAKPTAAAKPAPPKLAPSPPAQAAAPAPKPPVPAAAAAPVDYKAELEQLRAVAAKTAEQNHFELLGLKENADGSAVKIAYFKLAKLYHPDTVAADAPPELGKLKADLFARIGEAYRVLSDGAARAEYVENLKAGGGDGVDVAQILAAEETFQKACILVKARKFADAVKMLDEAIQMNADEGEFYAWRGYAKFFTFPDKKAGHAEAMKDLGVCLKKNARCAAAHYFQGQMDKLLGDLTSAKRHFQQCLDLQPNHIDAQRELRLMKK
ncbi:MAG: DnaJ domain-containing protein [Myxococcota bacterium]